MRLSRFVHAVGLLHSFFKNPAVSVKAVQDLAGLSPKADNELDSAKLVQ